MVRVMVGYWLGLPAAYGSILGILSLLRFLLITLLESIWLNNVLESDYDCYCGSRSL